MDDLSLDNSSLNNDYDFSHIDGLPVEDLLKIVDGSYGDWISLVHNDDDDDAQKKK